MNITQQQYIESLNRTYGSHMVFTVVPNAARSIDPMAAKSIAELIAEALEGMNTKTSDDSDTPEGAYDRAMGVLG
jgi:hypothetical protein